MKKSYLVTGAGSGIGKHLVHMLISRGENVLATDIKDADYRLDVTKPEDWEAAIREALARFGRLDVVLNVAGYLKPGWAHEMESAEVHRHFDVNVKGVVFGTQAAAREMVRQGSGHIVNIASLAGLLPVPGLALYSASKFAVRSFSVAVAQELAPHGVAVTVICPDAVRTPMLDLQRGYRQAELTFSAPRVLTVEDIGQAVERALATRASEIWLPRWRGWLGKLGDAFPGLAARLRPVLEWQGRRHQRKYIESDRSK